MHNTIILVGRLVGNIEVQQIDKVSLAKITLAVQRSFKNADGAYDSDIIPVYLYNVLATNTSEYCKKGDLCGVKGRIEYRDNELVVIADKVTFLQRNNKGE